MTSKPSSAQRRLSWVLLGGAAILAAWGVAIALTGGFYFQTGTFRISSRNPVRPLLVALLLTAAGWRLADRDRLAGIAQALGARARRASALFVLLIVPIAAAGLLGIGVLFGVRAAAASDTFGYVSQSALWLKGDVRIDQKFAATLPWPNPRYSLSPLGYRPGVDEAMVPTYAPGLPLLMAAARLVSPCGPYVVVPISAALLILSTFWLGRRLFNAEVGTVAALLVACSPVVLYMTLSPMADVPAAAFWTASLAVATARSARTATLSGVLAGVAILVRPNLVPLAVFPWLMAIVRCRSVREVAQRTALYGAGSVPFALFVAWLNNLLYGSPFTSGYGDLSPGFAVANAAVNAAHYPAWWWTSQGPFAFLFAVGLLRRGRPWQREALVLIGFASAVVLLYIFYQPFDAWWFLRFLLPAVPLLFLFSADAIDWAARGSRALRLAGLVALTVVTCAHTLAFIRERDIMGTGAGEQRYVEAGLYLASATPPESVIFTMQHSGSARYYSGRLTLRWDNLDPLWLDRAIEALAQRGVPSYLLLEYWEHAQFRQRFRGQAAMAELELGPLAVGWNGEIELYPLRAAGAGVRRSPETMPRRPLGPCLDMSPSFIRPAAIRRLR